MTGRLRASLMNRRSNRRLGRKEDITGGVIRPHQEGEAASGEPLSHMKVSNGNPWRGFSAGVQEEGYA